VAPFGFETLQLWFRAVVNAVPAESDECTAARGEEVGPGEGLSPSEIFERRGVALGLVPLAKLERHIDRVWVKAQLVVSDAPLANDCLALRQHLAPFAWIAQRQGERTENARTAERNAGLVTDLKSLSKDPNRLRPIPLQKSGSANIGEAALQKAARTEPLNQIKDKTEFGLQPTELAHRAQNEDVRHPGIDLGAQMADLSSGRGGGESLAENLTQRPEIDRRMGHLAVVGDLESPKTMQVGKVHAAFQVSVGGDHATAGVVCIAESAQRLGLQLGQVGLKSEVETLLMFSEAAFDVAAGEMQIAAQEMDAGAHLDETVLFSRGLGMLKVGESAVEFFRNSFDRREAKPGRRPRAVVCSGLERTS
jgi:hypothetical protein